MSRNSSRKTQDLRRHVRCLEIVADSDSTVLSRVCGILPSLNRIPDRVQSTIDADGGTLRLNILTNGWTDRQVDQIARGFAAAVCMRLSAEIGEAVE